MILLSGSASITVTGTTFDDAPDIEQSFSQAAGGDLKNQISGERFIFTENLRLTGAQYRTLLDILKDNLNDKYYTPTSTPPFLSASDFPMPVVIISHSKIRHVGGGAKRYYVSLTMKSASYL